jgi:S-adenosylmethionine-diacylglycerol 3-amino-3-carboxypropyl transferase
MSKKYFNQLNYSLANEDTTFELELVKRLKPKQILSIAGSGGRCLPLVIPGVRELKVIDMAQEQLWLVELKKESIEQLAHDEFLLFWGYAPYDFEADTLQRQELFYRLQLSKKVKRFFEKLFMQHQWRSLLYSGKWESTFGKLAKMAQFIMSKEEFLPFLLFDDIAKQKKYYLTEFNRKKWYVVLRILGNASMFNALLYKGHFVQKNIEQSHFAFYKEVFDYLFSSILVKDNFFLQLCLFGRILSSDGNTLEARPEHFGRLKRTLKKCHIDYYRGDILKMRGGQRYDFLSFSDVPSYFSGETERCFMQKIKKFLNPNAVVVVRYYLKICQQVDLTDFEDITSEFRDLAEQECVQVYHIRVYRYLK